MKKRIKIHKRINVIIDVTCEKEVPTELLTERMVRGGVDAFVRMMADEIKEVANRRSGMLTQAETKIDLKVIDVSGKD